MILFSFIDDVIELDVMFARRLVPAGVCLNF